MGRSVLLEVSSCDMLFHAVLPSTHRLAFALVVLCDNSACAPAAALPAQKQQHLA